MQIDMNAIGDILTIASQLLTALTILATVLVRIPALKKHAANVEGAAAKIQKAINYLPTIGINPRTKKLEEALREVQEQK